MSWIGWCLILLALYVGYLLLRAGVDLVRWLLDTFIREPKERERLRQLARQRRKNAAAAASRSPQAGTASPVIPIIDDGRQKLP